MSALLILRGLPACGKSTWSRAWVDDGEHRARVCRDDLRSMCHDGVFSVAAERNIVAVRDAAIATLLAAGCDVVSDDTNLPLATLTSLLEIGYRAGAAIVLVDMSNVEPGECLRRNALRQPRERVPDDVIEKMHAQWIQGKGWPLPWSEDGAAALRHTTLNVLTQAQIRQALGDRLQPR